MRLLLSRVRTVIGKYGFWGVIGKTAALFFADLCAFLPPAVLLHPMRTRREVRSMLASDCDRILLWRSSFGFQAALYQRPQQMARQLARQRCLVLYEASPLRDRVRSMRLLEPGLLLVNLRCVPLRRMLLHELERNDRPKILQLYSTNRECSLRELRSFLRRGWRVLYEYVDHLSPVISGTAKLPKNVKDKFDYVMAHPEIPVAVTAELLRQDVLRRRGTENLFLVGNGVDYSFFRIRESFRFEPGFQKLLDKGKPIVCYYGALAEWLDYALLRLIAADGRWTLVLIGVKYDASCERELRGVPGVALLGPRDYSVLKYYAAAADLLILPFRINELTRATNPVKLYEYMALHKPIVSTDVDECRRWRSVLTARTHEDFLRQMEKAMALRRDPAYLALEDREARENDWSKKSKQLLEAMP